MVSELTCLLRNGDEISACSTHARARVNVNQIGSDEGTGESSHHNHCNDQKRLDSRAIVNEEGFYKSAATHQFIFHIVREEATVAAIGSKHPSSGTTLGTARALHLGADLLIGGLLRLMEGNDAGEGGYKA